MTHCFALAMLLKVTDVGCEVDIKKKKKIKVRCAKWREVARIVGNRMSRRL